MRLTLILLAPASVLFAIYASVVHVHGRAAADPIAFFLGLSLVPAICILPLYWRARIVRAAWNAGSKGAGNR